MGKPDHKRRVLFISPQPFFEWRGSPIRVKFDVLALSELGYQVDLLTLPIGAEETVNDVNIIRAWNILGSKKISIGPSGLKLWFALIFLIQGSGLVLRNRYDVLHGTEEAGFICYLLSLLCKARCIFEKHSDSNSYQPKYFMKPILSAYRAVERLTVRNCKGVISTGPALDEQAKSMITATVVADKFSVIPDTPSSIVEACADSVAKARAEMESQPGQVIAMYAGSFASYQGIDIIFEAIPDVVRKNKLARFVIIGGSDEEVAYYQEQLAAKGMADEVLFLGKIQPDLLPAYLAASDILLAPRKSGVNSPLKILDYFKAGAAIVATNTVANKRLLDQSNAMLCEFNVKHFSDTINSLIESPEKRKSLGKNAYKLYKSTYNFNVFKGQLNDAYKAVLL
ncbi:MAG: glycosyltransferase [Arenicella sp.]